MRILASPIVVVNMLVCYKNGETNYVEGMRRLNRALLQFVDELDISQFVLGGLPCPSTTCWTRSSKNGRQAVLGQGKPWEWKPVDLAGVRVYMAALLKKCKKI